MAGQCAIAASGLAGRPGCRWGGAVLRRAVVAGGASVPVATAVLRDSPIMPRSHSTLGSGNAAVELVRGLYNLRAQHRPCALTIGAFDGIHLGHQQMLRVLR